MVAQADLPATTAAASHTWVAPSRRGDEAPVMSSRARTKGNGMGSMTAKRGEGLPPGRR
jgi:hypothetical protein